MKKDPIFKEYIEFKLQKYTRVYENIKDETDLAQKRKLELEGIIIKLKEFLQCL
jgi:tRNA (adenine22-N1)-methyltransferase